MCALVIVPCSDRKLHRPAANLVAQNLTPGPLGDVASEWAIKVLGAGNRIRSANLYGGRSFREAQKAANGLNAGLWIISAGLGLISGNSTVPSYSLTVSPSSKDFVGDKVLESEWAPSNWWEHLKKNNVSNTNFSDLFSTDEDQLVLLSLSKNYVQMIADDLNRLNSCALNRLRIFGYGLKPHLPSRIRPSLMPYDNRLDGLDSPINGTRSDFGARALYHFSQSLLTGQFKGDSSKNDAFAVLESLEGWARPSIPKRVQKSDDDIIDLIRQNWTSVRGQSGLMLRFLRDRLGVACEQGRFRSLFQKVADERHSEQGDLL